MRGSAGPRKVRAARCQTYEYVTSQVSRPTSLRLPSSLRACLEAQARREDRSLSGQIRHLLQIATELCERQIATEVDRLAALASEPDGLEWH